MVYTWLTPADVAELLALPLSEALRDKLLADSRFDREQPNFAYTEPDPLFVVWRHQEMAIVYCNEREADEAWSALKGLLQGGRGRAVRAAASAKG